jgi:hypothetical protein
MPIPKPHGDENQGEFIGRCMGDDVMVNEYPENDQRYAICLSSWEKVTKENLKMEQKTFKFEIKSVNEETGIFESYGATFSNVADSYNDVIEKGSFVKTLQEGGKRVKILFNHNVNEPIGKPLEMKEDEHGLWVKGKLSLGVQRAREVLALMKDGVINEMSIGYDTILSTVIDGVRHLKEIRLWDVSPVTFAANPEARIMSVKGVLPQVMEDLSTVSQTLNNIQALLKSDEKGEPDTTTLPEITDDEAAKLDKVFEDIQKQAEGEEIIEVIEVTDEMERAINNLLASLS